MWNHGVTLVVDQTGADATTSQQMIQMKAKGLNKKPTAGARMKHA